MHSNCSHLRCSPCLSTHGGLGLYDPLSGKSVYAGGILRKIQKLHFFWTPPNTSSDRTRTNQCSVCLTLQNWLHSYFTPRKASEQRSIHHLNDCMLSVDVTSIPLPSSRASSNWDISCTKNPHQWTRSLLWPSSPFIAINVPMLLLPFYPCE